MSDARALVAIGALALIARLVVWPHSTEANMDPDAAHFLNIARCFERGQGFSNPAAWPAWMRPDSLPMPETFKEPAYPWLIAKLTPLAGGGFPAGKLISFLAGLLTPLFTWMLARRLHPDRGVALLAGVLAAASPLLIAQSARVMVESVFAAAFALLWVTLASRTAAPPFGWYRRRQLALDLAAGALAGIAFMLRAQTLLAAPAVLALILTRDSGRRALARVAVVLVAAIATASPFLLRNLRLFGSPFHSDISAFAMMAYMDYLDLRGGLTRPPAPIGWALAHPGAVLLHSAASALRFAVRTLPKDILGNPLWTVPLAAGLALSLARWRDWLFVYLYLGVTLPFIFAVNWDARYFASSVPLWCVLAASGAGWIANALGPAPLLGRLRGRHLLAGALVGLVLVQIAAARREVADQVAEENSNARAAAPFLREHLGPHEAVMCLTTSYYAWFADRPARFVVFADEPTLLDDLRHFRVRYAVFPTDSLAGIASRYPGGRLPAAFAPDHVDAAHDLTVFRVRDAGAR